MGYPRKPFSFLPLSFLNNEEPIEIQLPCVQGEPHLWAESRQGLNYFRSYHSGVYSKNGLVYGYLIDKIPRVFISHGGGRSGRAEQKSDVELLSSQKETDCGVNALMRNIELEMPVAVIIGNEYPAAHFSIPHRYCLLGFYAVTHTWPFKLGNGKIQYKFRFEWLPQQPYRMWWAKNVCRSLFECRNLESFECLICMQSSHRVFVQKTCLNVNCSNYLKAMTGDDEDYVNISNLEEFRYSPAFVQSGLLNKSYYESVLPFELLPKVQPLNFLNVTKEIWKARYCRKCGRLSCLEVWRYWKCLSCGESYSIDWPVIHAASLRPAFQILFEGPSKAPFAQVFCSEQVKLHSRDINGTTYNHYTLPNDCLLIHVLANKTLRKVADDLFRRFQQPDTSSHFKRQVLRSTKGIFNLNQVASRMLSNYFSFNYGKAYIHAHELKEKNMENGPAVLCSSVLHIKNYLRGNYNQILAVLYVVQQKMEWHDDGEDSVFGDVASLSLGSEAEMHFREKDNPRKLLSITLQHGDMLLMKDKKFQKHYEHKVISKNYRIAVTARHITE